MHFYKIKPGRSLEGSISVPPSKSQTMRAILLASLADGVSVIHNPLQSTDTNCMIDVCRDLGAEISRGFKSLSICGMSGSPRFRSKTIDVGNSGIILRFVGACAALDDTPIIFTGDQSIQTTRIVQPLIDGINQLGGKAASLKCNKRAPLSISGPITAGKVQISGEDSQPVSALIIAAAFLPGKTTIEVKKPGEKPWIDMTLDWLDRLGIVYVNEDYKRYTVYGTEGIGAFEYSIASDFSSSAFPLAAAAITGSSIALENIDVSDSQGDKRIIAILQEMGVEMLYNPRVQELKLNTKGKLKGCVFDLNDCVDLLPVLSVLGCYAEGKTEIKNVKVARSKECDRIASTASQLKKMGAKVEEKKDSLTVYQSDLKGATLKSYNDHRLAMAFSVAAMGAQGPTVVEDVGCVSKTFPHFSSAMQMLGADIQVGS